MKINWRKVIKIALVDKLAGEIALLPFRIIFELPLLIILSVIIKKGMIKL